MSQQQSQQQGQEGFDPAAVEAALAADRGEATSDTQQEQGGGEPDAKVIEEARTDGWVPKEEWRGEPDKWVDAGTFVERGRHIRPILEANLRRRDERIANLEQTLDRNVKIFEAERRRAEEAGYQRKQAEIETAKSEAVRAGDLEAYDKAMQREKTLVKPEAPKQEQTKADGQDPVLTGWMAENAWYTKDKQTTTYANGIAEDLRRENPQLQGRAFLDEVRREVEVAFPTKFTNPARSAPSAVAGAAKPAAGGKGRTFNDLPADAKSVCMKMEKMGIKRDDYVKDYFAQESK